MRKLLLLSFFIISISFSSKAQYLSVVNDTNQYWKIYNSRLFPMPVVFADSIYLGGKYNYNNIQYRQVLSDTRVNGPGFAFNPTVGYIREDTTLGRLWYLEDTLQNYIEQLVYDFTLSKGDTFQVIANNSAVISQFVLDTTYTENGRRRSKLHMINDSMFIEYIFFPTQKRFFYDTLEFIEGVGSTRGLDNRNQPNFVMEYTPYLLCHFKGQTQTYQHRLDTSIKFINQCDTAFPPGIVIGAGELSVAEEVQIYPNPSRGLVNIESDLLIAEVLIYDINGRLMDRLKKPGKQFQLPEADNVFILEIELEDGNKIRRKILRY